MRRLHSGSSAAWPCLVLALFGASLSLTAQGPATTPPGPNAPFDFAIKRQWLTDLRAQKTFLPKFRITMTDRSAVHDSPDDCEMHLAGTLTDTVFGDPQPVVVEPPNLCKFKPGSTTPVTGTTSTKALWATKIDNAVLKKDCTVEGFPRVYTEHATGGGLGSSNPRHVFEIHPSTDIVCGSTDLPFIKFFRSFPDLRHISAGSAHTCITQLKMWVRYHDADGEDQYEFFCCQPGAASAPNCLTPVEAEVVDLALDGSRNDLGRRVWFPSGRATDLSLALPATGQGGNGIFAWAHKDLNFEWRTGPRSNWDDLVQLATNTFADYIDMGTPDLSLATSEPPVISR